MNCYIVSMCPDEDEIRDFFTGIRKTYFFEDRDEAIGYASSWNRKMHVWSFSYDEVDVVSRERDLNGCGLIYIRCDDVTFVGKVCEVG